MFSLQEYQHVHLLWFKKRSFTLVWKPNPPLRSICCAHLRARADAASESTMGALLPLCIRAASALPLLCVRCETRLYWSARTWSVKSFSCYNVLRLAARALWSSADHALAQVRPCQILKMEKKTEFGKKINLKLGKNKYLFRIKAAVFLSVWIKIADI